MGYIDFTFNGISARDMRVKSVRVEENIMTIPFVTSADLNTTRLPGSIETFMYQSNREPLTIRLELMLVDENGNPKVWTSRDLYNIADWLVQDGYKPLTLGDEVGKIYYAHLLESENLQHYANGGILPITFTTNSPYAWSVVRKDNFNISVSKNIMMVNESNVTQYYRPLLEIKSNKASNKITIQNETIDGDRIELNNIQNGETIIMNNEYEIIESDKAMAKMHDRFNYKWLKLKRGNNNIVVTGACDILVTYQFPIIM